MKPVKIEGGHELHIRGFIMNKLYVGGYFSKKGRKHHGKHTSVKNLPKGYPLKHRDKFPGEIKALRRKGLILVFPSVREMHVCAVLAPEATDTGIYLANAYRQSVDLPLLDEKFKEILK